METFTAAANAASIRLAIAEDPQTANQTLWQMIDDPNDLVAKTARRRLGLGLRPTAVPHVVQIPVTDPATGRIVA